MYARVTEFRIQPDKEPAFLDAVHSMMPLARKQKGYRAVIVLRMADARSPEAMIIALWDSHAELKASEKNLFYSQVLARLLAVSDGFPRIREQEVLANDFVLD